MAFVNLTPHDIDVFDESGCTLLRKFAKCGTVARLSSSEQKHIGTLFETVPVVSAQSFTSLELPQDVLPENVAGIIVSMPVGQWIQTHETSIQCAVYGPDTSPSGVVRSEGGAIVGTKRLVCYVEAKK